jgi:hypothetical protein
LAAANLEQRHCILQILVATVQAFDEPVVIEGDQWRIIFSDHSAHAIDGDGIAVLQMNDQFVDGPNTGPRSRLAIGIG